MSSDIGVDACPLGWCVTELDDVDISTNIFEKFDEIPATYPNAYILVDIPIGLPTKSRRRCDKGAKDILGCRGS